ncbi:hypothetical protein PpBr36_05460 [Pyricularia pennisetigena]|uniref:hypothetical protein n=1 Tax=Pyricularia pennisetigena TaxID=1578925 RepID=UPI001150371F|nr:hypothetical protein PpBr36_05460 [Pyricularia pennisetigena]TLS27452.1 hypothetical protein PpBr36_05460 [Pyricularia pennisetigena]
MLDYACCRMPTSHCRRSPSGAAACISGRVSSGESIICCARREVFCLHGDRAALQPLRSMENGKHNATGPVNSNALVRGGLVGCGWARAVLALFSGEIAPLCALAAKMLSFSAEES